MIALRAYAPIVVLAPLFLIGCGKSDEDTRGDGSASATLSAGSISFTNPDPTGGMDGTGDSSDSAVTGGLSGTATGNVDTGPMDTGADEGVAPKFDLGGTPDAGTNCGGGDGVLDTSYIWIPATSDGWVSKINTRTMIEENRYLTGPNGVSEDVSRTAVSGDGRFVIVNGRMSGRSTAVAANVDDCIDFNGDGVISTSTSAADVLPWTADECVVWTLVHPAFDGNQTHGPRGISWTAGEWNPGLCGFVNPKVWLGYLSIDGTAHLVRLDGPTGAFETELLVPGWDGSGYAPYGGALDPLQRPWFTGLRGELVRVDTDLNPITFTRISQPIEIQTYGMTVDPDGNPWMAGCSGPVSTYDIATGTWISIAGTNACHRGMAVDHNFHVWAASNGPCGLVEVDGKTRTLVAQHTLAQCSTPIGVSVDVDGFVWLVDQEGWAWKIDPLNVPAMQMMAVPGSHYVYSDMTGGQLKSVSPPPG